MFLYGSFCLGVRQAVAHALTLAPPPLYAHKRSFLRCTSRLVAKGPVETMIHVIRLDNEKINISNSPDL